MPVSLAAQLEAAPSCYMGRLHMVGLVEQGQVNWAVKLIGKLSHSCSNGGEVQVNVRGQRVN